MGIKHTFVSGVADASNTALVRPTNWNAEHIIDSAIDLPAGSTLDGGPFSTVPGPAGATGPAGADGLNAPDYVDIRDYGTVVDGGDITAALNAALAAVGATGKRIRIPWVGNGNYTLGALVWPVGSIRQCIEFHCSKITLTATMEINVANSGPVILRGLAGASGSGGGIAAPTPNPSPGPWIDGTAVDPAIQVGNAMTRIEGLSITGKGTAIQYSKPAPGGDCSEHTIYNCTLATQGNVAGASPLVVSCYWFNISHCTMNSAAGVGSPYSMIFNSPNTGDFTGLIVIKDVLMLGGKGMLIDPDHGNGAGTISIEGLSNETMMDGGALLNLNSGGNPVLNVWLRRAWIADPLGDASTIRNVGVNTTSNVTVSEVDGFNMTPDSDEIMGLRIIPDNGFAQSYNIIPSYTRAYSVQWPGTLDAKLATAPRGPQLIVGTVLPITQDPASWTPDSTSVVTTGFLDPDGGTLAGEVSNAGGSAGAYCYNVSGQTLSIGDWFIAGCWVQRAPSDPQGTPYSLYNLTPEFTIEHGGGSGMLINESIHIKRIGTADGQTLRTDSAWVWLCDAYKVLGFNGGASNDIVLQFKLGIQTNAAKVRHYNPSAQYFPVSLGLTDGDVMNLARSYRGGWPPTAVRADVSILDSQSLRMGTSKHVAKTFATLPSSPVAGQQAYITNCTTNTFGAVAAGGGANKVMVWYNGTNWTVMGA